MPITALRDLLRAILAQHAVDDARLEELHARWFATTGRNPGARGINLRQLQNRLTQGDHDSPAEISFQLFHHVVVDLLGLTVTALALHSHDALGQPTVFTHTASAPPCSSAP